MTRAYGVLNDDPAMAQDTKRIAGYLRAKRSWFIVDRNGVVVYARVTDPRGLVPNDEMLEVLEKLKLRGAPECHAGHGFSAGPYSVSNVARSGALIDSTWTKGTCKHLG